MPASRPDSFDLKTGDMIFGHVELYPNRGLPTDGKWAWAISQGAGGGGDRGSCATRDEAIAKVEEAFQAWLEWADLREKASVARKVLRSEYSEKCPHCNGTAKIPIHGGLRFKACPWCHGTGLKDPPRKR